MAIPADLARRFKLALPEFASWRKYRGKEPYIGLYSISSIFAAAADYDEEMPRHVRRRFYSKKITDASAPVEGTYAAAASWLSRRCAELARGGTRNDP